MKNPETFIPLWRKQIRNSVCEISFSRGGQKICNAYLINEVWMMVTFVN